MHIVHTHTHCGHKRNCISISPLLCMLRLVASMRCHVCACNGSHQIFMRNRKLLRWLDFVPNIKIHIRWYGLSAKSIRHHDVRSFTWSIVSIYRNFFVKGVNYQVKSSRLYTNTMGNRDCTGTDKCKFMRRLDINDVSVIYSTKEHRFRQDDVRSQRREKWWKLQIHRLDVVCQPLSFQWEPFWSKTLSAFHGYRNVFPVRISRCTFGRHISIRCHNWYHHLQIIRLIFPSLFSLSTHPSTFSSNHTDKGFGGVSLIFWLNGEMDVPFVP